MAERGPGVVLMLHGGHMRAGLPLGEEVFADAGYTVLAPSRPGYGRTPLATGASPDRFADVLAELCGVLGFGAVDVVGQSAGGPVAVALAARHPGLVRRLILQSAVGPVPWPDRLTRLGGRVVFGRLLEPVIWALIHGLVRRAPGLAQRLLMSPLTTRPVAEVLAGLTAPQRAALLAMFGRMRSGAGFGNDLRITAAPGRPAAQVRQPTLVIATRSDGSVPYVHAEALASAIPGARLVESGALSHMIWLGDDYPAIAAAITGFLTE
ncbi:alpha/beta fold hydrolase [Actinomadura sp. DC4]|uniref:alpha/beta fold hydrolase n=1 Tax=Actinomadura sp. DC4 TaxID=3055069 RepID=UPI0025B07955|nr:alpha/beta fold hydrolase [Actinomadura sp. DC4]MDN3353433.1 alpha/beta fold hydrolase [Actinomadura sp. DC4]